MPRFGYRARSVRDRADAEPPRPREDSDHNGQAVLPRPVSLDKIEAIAIGAWILGTGGGGSPSLALLNLSKL
jgi:hypothetical protein